MQLADLGRNEPCPCGSGRKFKKCCLAARDAAVAGRATDLDVAALVDQAIASDDWDAVHTCVDRALEVFEPGAPLEHVRFRDDRITTRRPDRDELANLCTPGWVSQCELEIARVLRRVELDREVRDGLRMAAHLVRRFGARSPIVEQIAELQVAERIARVRRFANVLSARRITAADVEVGSVDLLDWIERARPAVLPFSGWFALRTLPEEQRELLWLSSLAPQVCDTVLERLESITLDEPLPWIQLASIAQFGLEPWIGWLLALATAPRDPTAEEQRLFDDITQKRGSEELRGSLHRIVAATEERRDYGGAARLRAVMQVIQRGLR
jgi:hypothetical protein